MGSTSYQNSDTATIANLTRASIRKTDVLTRCEREVVMALFNHWLHHRHKDGGKIHPGQDKIAKKARVSKRMVAYTESALRDAGVLIAVANERGYGRKPTVYLFDIFALWEMLGYVAPTVSEGALRDLSIDPEWDAKLHSNGPKMECNGCTQTKEDVGTVLARKSAANGFPPK